jgi:hypothetical protein
MTLRKQFIAYLFEISQNVYTRYFKKQAPWKTSKEDLLMYSKGTFGNALGTFLNTHNYKLIPKVERHDAYHVLTGYGTTAEDEIALQYLCYGNGKRSLYLYGVILLGTLILPDYLSYYWASYGIGKAANTFHHFNYERLLNASYLDLKYAIFSKEQIGQIQLLTQH